jgi:hypothetical protein
VTQTAQAIDRAFIDAFAERWHDAGTPTILAASLPCAPPTSCWCSRRLQRNTAVPASSSRSVSSRPPSATPIHTDEPPLLSADGRKAIAPWRMTGTMTGPLVPPGFAPTGQRLTLEGDDHWESRTG